MLLEEITLYNCKLLKKDSLKLRLELRLTSAAALGKDRQFDYPNFEARGNKNMQ